MTEDQVDAIVKALNVAIAEAGLSRDDAVAVLAGCYTEAATTTWGPTKAAQQTYLLALQLAKAAGLDAPAATAPTSSLSH